MPRTQKHAGLRDVKPTCTNDSDSFVFKNSAFESFIRDIPSIVSCVLEFWIQTCEFLEKLDRHTLQLCRDLFPPNLSAFALICWISSSMRRSKSLRKNFKKLFNLQIAGPLFYLKSLSS